jgi:hypothetical protein
VEARGVEDTEKTIEAFCVNKLRIYWPLHPQIGGIAPTVENLALGFVLACILRITKVGLHQNWKRFHLRQNGHISGTGHTCWHAFFTIVNVIKINSKELFISA